VASDAQIRQLLLERNDWWRDGEWERNDPYLREAAQAPFDYRPAPLADVHPPGVYVLTGPRRVGKSLELRRTIAGLLTTGVPPRTIIYGSCDGFTKQDLRRLFSVGRALTRTVEGPRYWMIDEVTAVTDWSPVVKDLRDDTELRDDCVVLSGSSARQFRDATKNLAGRRGGIEDSDRLLLPMTFRSFCRAIGLTGVPDAGRFRPRDLMSREARRAYDELEVWTIELTQAWESYLLVGGFPRAVGDFISYGDVQSSFMSDVWDVIRGEAIRSTSLSETELLAFLARLALGMTTPLNASSVARDAGLGSHHQVNDRINDLFFAFLAWRVFQNARGKPNMQAQRKVYFTDPLIARIPPHLNTRHIRPDDTKMSEQQLGFHLARSVERQRRGSFLATDGVLYERTPTGNEIDFVGPDLEIPIESKYVDTGWKREAQTVRAAYGKGVLATRSIYDTTENVWAVPTALIVWVLDV
jgi:predicted AAA+ superfamily ATPase